MSEFTNARSGPGVYALSWNSAQDGKLVVELDRMTITDANPSAERMTGYSQFELIGMELMALSPPVEHERMRKEIAADGGDPIVYLGFSILRKDGDVVPIMISTSGVLHWEGRALAIVELRDITGLLAAERQISAQNWALSAFSVAAEALERAQTSGGFCSRSVRRLPRNRRMCCPG